MQTTTAILLALIIIAFAFNRQPDKNKPASSRLLNGWQKLLGVVAVVLAILTIINPEFFALGLFGDTAFFDMLVLALTLQMHTLILQAFRWCATRLGRGMRWMVTPSPGIRWLVAVSSFAIGTAISTIQKAIHRIIS